MECGQGARRGDAGRWLAGQGPRDMTKPHPVYPTGYPGLLERPGTLAGQSKILQQKKAFLPFNVASTLPPTQPIKVETFLKLETEGKSRIQSRFILCTCIFSFTQDAHKSPSPGRPGEKKKVGIKTISPCV